METVEVLRYLAEKMEEIHGADSDWWRGYISGLRRAASMVEVNEAFRGGSA